MTETFVRRPRSFTQGPRPRPRPMYTRIKTSVYVLEEAQDQDHGPKDDNTGVCQSVSVCVCVCVCVCVRALRACVSAWVRTCVRVTLSYIWHGGKMWKCIEPRHSNYYQDETDVLQVCWDQAMTLQIHFTCSKPQNGTMQFDLIKFNEHITNLF